MRKLVMSIATALSAAALQRPADCEKSSVFNQQSQVSEQHDLLKKAVGEEGHLKCKVCYVIIKVPLCTV